MKNLARDREIRYARSYSKRHNSKIYVEHVVKGRGKGRYCCRHEDSINIWWPSSVVEVAAVYENGKRI